MPVARKGESQKISLTATVDFFFSSGLRERAESCRVCNSLGLGHPHSPSLPLQTQASPCANLALYYIHSRSQIDSLLLLLPINLLPFRTSVRDELLTRKSRQQTLTVMTDPRPVSANIAVLLHEDGSRPLTHSDAMPMGNSRLPRPMSTYKPLPSPPIAQVSSPNSPPKAQRTLIDAQSESSIHGRWPVLHPENVSPPSNSLAQDSYDGAGDDRSIRLKPLSWHASDADANAHTGTGPILKISADADEFILGTGDDISEVPPIPAVFTERLQQTRSFSNLRARLAEVTEYKSSLSNAPPAPTVHPVRTLRSLTPVVKISPIRSMQPARKVSPASHSPMSSSPLARPSTSSNSEDKVVVITADNTTRATNHSDHHMKLTGSASKPTIIVSEPTASPEIFESTESRQVRQSRLFFEGNNSYIRSFLHLFQDTLNCQTTSQSWR